MQSAAEPVAQAYHQLNRISRPFEAIFGLAGRGRRVPREGLLQLTSKRAPRNFYKGKGVKSTGRHTRKGAFQLLKERLPNFVVPDLSNTKLKPYVAPKD